METLSSIGSFIDLLNIRDAVAIAVTGVLTYLSKHVKDYLQSRKECELEKATTEKENSTISNAIDYVKEVYDKEKIVRPELTKIDLALEYIRIVEPKVYDSSGNDRLKLIIQRIVYKNKV